MWSNTESIRLIYRWPSKAVVSECDVLCYNTDVYIYNIYIYYIYTYIYIYMYLYMSMCVCVSVRAKLILHLVFCPLAHMAKALYIYMYCAPCIISYDHDDVNTSDRLVHHTSSSSQRERESQCSHSGEVVSLSVSEWMSVPFVDWDIQTDNNTERERSPPCILLVSFVSSEVHSFNHSFPHPFTCCLVLVLVFDCHLFFFLFSFLWCSLIYYYYWLYCVHYTIEINVIYSILLHCLILFDIIITITLMTISLISLVAAKSNLQWFYCYYYCYCLCLCSPLSYRSHCFYI